MRDFLIEAQAGKPAPRQMHAQFLDQLALAGDAIQIADQQDAQHLPIFPHSHEVSPSELPWRVSWLTKCAQNPPVLIELNNPVVAPIDHPDVLIRADEETIRVSNTRPLLQEIPFRIEDLDPLVLAIPHINVALFVYRNAVWQIEFTRTRSVFPPGLQEVPVAIKLHHPRVAVSVGNIDFPVLPESHVRWLIEQPV